MTSEQHNLAQAINGVSVHGQSTDVNDRAATTDDVVPAPKEKSGSFVHRHEGGDSLVRSFLGEDEPAQDDLAVDRWRRTCCCWTNGNMRALMVTSVLWITITGVQWVAASIAHSNAMRADCVSMTIDAGTYFTNIFVEMVKGKPIHRPATLIIPAFSISLLAYFTVQVLMDAINTLQDPSGGDNDDVVGAIVLAFAIAGLIFDGISIYVFYRNQRRSGESLRLGINMLAAFMHVGADFCRSATTLIESVLILGFGFNGTITDAYACIVVSGIILLGAAFAACEWIKDLVDFTCKERKSARASATSSKKPDRVAEAGP